ncbi:Metallo-dependent phosphatase-like protein [Glomus cerebriforme]|uniref:Metallo-dependent phosphatase-like protein n=1 Tax=Glomus cerebriforme TaxID=658196 RepID=A0A397SJR2_9GLOM|nr:Metallo-dependent phosphatase-like protein [Glomus cerebriforme]
MKLLPIITFIIIQYLLITSSATPIIKTPTSLSILETSNVIYEEIYKDDKLDYLVIGDWGFQGKGVGQKHGNQKNVAFVMKKWAERYNSQFIINVGDSFYKSEKDDHQGVDSVDDEKWKVAWLDVYKGRLAEIPWYSVAGNHDWYNNVTAEIDYSLNVNSRFFMPSLFYVRTSIFGNEEKTKVAWIHIDTNLFFYEYDWIQNDGMKNNFNTLGWDNNKEVEMKLRWIEQQLIEQQDANWIFVAGHHPLIGTCATYYYMPKLIELFESYGVSGYFAGHAHVLEYKSPKPNSPVAYFTSGAASRTSDGCGGKDWGMPEGTFGFLHATITANEMTFSFVNATTTKDKVVYQGKLTARSIWNPK